MYYFIILLQMQTICNNVLLNYKGETMKKNIKLLFLLTLILSITGCSKATNNSSSESSNLSVSISFHAMEELVKVVGQDKITISTIVPAGVEPHDFEPKVADIAKLGEAHVFVYNGLGMESWAEKTIESAENDSLIVINASENADMILDPSGEEITYTGEDQDHEDADAHEDEHHDEDADTHEDEHEGEDADEHEDEHTHDHGRYDPHIWLSLKGAASQVQAIANGLSQADPDNETFYQENATAYIHQLDELYEEYREKFDSLKNKNFVTGHAAFQYFCRDFGLQQNSVEDVFSQGEPSTRQLAELVDYCIANQVTTIFSEESASPAVSQTLANEIGAQVVPIHTIERPEGEMSYLDRMRENCEKVYDSLSK